MAIKVEAEIGGQTFSLEAGKLAEQADGAVLVRYGDTVLLATAVSAEPREGIDFFPHDRGLRGAHVRRGQDPGRLHQARVAPVGGGHPGHAPHRPADPPALPEGLQAGGPDRPDGAQRRSGERSGHPGRERRVRGAVGEQHPVPGAGRRRARRAASTASSSPTRPPASSRRATWTWSWRAPARR